MGVVEHHAADLKALYGAESGRGYSDYSFSSEDLNQVSDGRFVEISGTSKTRMPFSLTKSKAIATAPLKSGRCSKTATAETGQNSPRLLSR